MRVAVVTEPSIQASLRKRVTQDITQSLCDITTQGSKFVVNDTLWYARRRRGGVGPCVVNSATFISSKFQRALSTRSGWSGETEIDGQSIDGYGELHEQGVGYQLSRATLFKFLDEYTNKHLPTDVDLGAVTARIYGMYVARKLFGIDDLPHELHDYFSAFEIDAPVRIGVEFETGNIASSFRALTKLGNLFSANRIDAGVFITSIDKASGASRIWPVSNRNGSFQELLNRRHRANLTLPLWEIGFAPDSFDGNAKYLASDGSLYLPSRVEDSPTIRIDGVSYSEWTGEHGDSLLRDES